MIAITGASTNRNLFAPVGTMISFSSSFSPSAIGCAAASHGCRRTSRGSARCAPGSSRSPCAPRASGRPRTAAAAATIATILASVQTAGHAGPSQRLRIGEQGVEHYTAAFCCAGTRSTVSSPNIAPSAAVSGRAAASRMQPGGQLVVDGARARPPRRRPGARAPDRPRASPSRSESARFIDGDRRRGVAGLLQRSARAARSRRPHRSALRRCARARRPARRACADGAPAQGRLSSLAATSRAAPSASRRTSSALS